MIKRVVARDEVWFEVDGGSDADEGFTVVADRELGWLRIRSARYEETAYIRIEKVPLLLEAMQGALGEEP